MSDRETGPRGDLLFHFSCKEYWACKSIVTGMHI